MKQKLVRMEATELGRQLFWNTGRKMEIARILSRFGMSSSNKIRNFLKRISKYQREKLEDCEWKKQNPKLKDGSKHGKFLRGKLRFGAKKEFKEEVI